MIHINEVGINMRVSDGTQNTQQQQAQQQNITEQQREKLVQQAVQKCLNTIRRMGAR